MEFSSNRDKSSGVLSGKDELDSESSGVQYHKEEDDDEIQKIELDTKMI